tara:strand:+ start:1633 stop:2514 length:882 start_codon:yes stop_codon:yes gene_type:complete
MGKYLIKKSFGEFAVSESGKVIPLTDALKKQCKPLPKNLSRLELEPFRDKSYFTLFRESNLQLTKSSLQTTNKDDLLIIQVSNSIEETKKCINILTTRVREWYGWYFPEAAKRIEDNKHFIDIVVKNNIKESFSKLKIKETVGIPLKEKDVTIIINSAKHILTLWKQIEVQEAYLSILMKSYCPNLNALAGSLIGAKLLDQSSSLKHLSEFPSSTIQVLGAEKALFRHLKTGASSPKFGFIHEHPLVLKAKRSMQGKVARALADKLAIAAKVDYFKGTLIGPELLKQLEKKFK